VYDPTVPLIASALIGIGVEAVPLGLDVGSTELETDGEMLLWVLPAELDGDAELPLESLPPFVPFLT
jgi:hypothetical protein